MSVIFCGLCCLLALVVRCEIGALAGRDSSLSLFSLVVHSPSTSPRGIVVFVLVTLGYYAAVVVWTLDQARLGARRRATGARW